MNVTVLARHAVSAARPPTRLAAGAPTVHSPGSRQRYRRRRQTTVVSVQNNTGSFVINEVIEFLYFCLWQENQTSLFSK